MNAIHHPGAGWRIRYWQRDDSRAILSLFADCLTDFPWRGDPQRYQQQLMIDAARFTVLVADEPSAGLVGFMVVDIRNGYVSHLFVDRDWRFCGIGREMLNLARRAAEKPLRLDVDTQNTGARAAYEALGWQVLVDAKPPRGEQQIRLIGP